MNIVIYFAALIDLYVCIFDHMFAFHFILLRIPHFFLGQYYSSQSLI